MAPLLLVLHTQPHDRIVFLGYFYNMASGHNPCVANSQTLHCTVPTPITT